jgi:hypothetical protein
MVPSIRELAVLYRELAGRKVLSVYVNGEARDPAERHAWRRRLMHALAGIRGELAGDAAERAEFEAAAAHIEGALAGVDAFLPGRGWVGFATPDRLWYAGSLPAPMPDEVHWGVGLRVAPQIRGLKQNRPVAALLLDRRRARIFRYVAGRLDEPVDLVAETDLGDLTDARAGKRAATRTGMRGSTGTDTAQRLLAAGAERLLRAAVDRVVETAGDDGFLVLGGTPEMTAAAERRLPDRLRDRVLANPSLHLEMSSAEVKDALEAAASTLSARLHRALAEEVVDLARAGGRGCTGIEATASALGAGSVDLLLFTRSFREAHPEEAERAVGAALLEGALIEEVAGSGAEILDAAGGIGARLRYRLPETAGVA